MRAYRHKWARWWHTHTHAHLCTHDQNTHSPLQAFPPAEINIHAWRVLCYRSATHLTKWSFVANPCASELCWERIPLTAERCPQTCFKETPGLFEVQENRERRCLGGFPPPDALSPSLPLSRIPRCVNLKDHWTRVRKYGRDSWFTDVI